MDRVSVHMDQELFFRNNRKAKEKEEQKKKKIKSIVCTLSCPLIDQLQARSSHKSQTLSNHIKDVK